MSSVYLTLQRTCKDWIKQSSERSKCMSVDGSARSILWQGSTASSQQSGWAGAETLPATLGCTHRFFLDDNPRAKICGTFCPGPRKYLKFTKPVQGSSRNSNPNKNAQAAAVLLNCNAADGIWAGGHRLKLIVLEMPAAA